jgi:beta-glucanase (GH16 family)
MRCSLTSLLPLRLLLVKAARAAPSRLPIYAASILLLCAAAAPLQGQAWRLVWSDEFNSSSSGTSPDGAKWNYEQGAGGYGNGEQQTYCRPGSDAAPCSAAAPNAYQDGRGHLVIEARRDSSGDWTSARLKTQGLYQFTYGRIEARIKVPVGDGLWPAFWMLGSNFKTVGWPQCGEQDIMEWVQSYGPAATSSTTHGPGYSGGHGIKAKYTLPQGGRVDDGYHVYGLTWSPNRVEYYRDSPSNVFLTLTPASLPAGVAWVYDHPIFIILNLAIGGGGFAGTTDSTTPAGAQMLVDYVHVYQQTGRINAGGPAVGAFLADSGAGATTGGSFAHSRAVNIPAGVLNPAPALVYQSNRFGNFNYTLSGYAAGSTHTIRLHFAELYWTGRGQRIFNVNVNGVPKLTNFDILAAAGAPFTANVQQFTAQADAQGRFVIEFRGVKGQATVSGTEIE